MVVDQKYIEDHYDEMVKSIKDGLIFIYPTDTIYGIGCNAYHKESVAKIRRLKQRELKPFSIIAPHMEWIDEFCMIKAGAEIHLAKLPGPYTLIMRLRDENKIPEEVNPLGNGTIGVRMPHHWFAKLITQVGVPFITTSVNISGMPYMTSLETLDETIKNNVDFIIYEGENSGKESTKIDLTHLV